MPEKAETKEKQTEQDPPQEGQPASGAGDKAPPERPAVGVLDDAEIQRRIEEGVKAELTRKQQETDRAAAEKQGEYEALYLSLKAEHETAQAELADLRKQNGKLTKQVNAQIDAEVAAWDDAVLKLTDPGPDDLAARLAWVEKLRPELAKRAADGSKRKSRDETPAGPAAHAPGANGHGGDDGAARASQATLYRNF